MELLDERWTLLVVRELVSGSQRFNELRRGVPRMSPTLLSKRLHELALAGVVRRIAEGNDVHYVLTEEGQELRPVVVERGLGPQPYERDRVGGEHARQGHVGDQPGLDGDPGELPPGHEQEQRGADAPPQAVDPHGPG